MSEHAPASADKKHGRRFAFMIAAAAAYGASFAVSAGEKALFDAGAIHGPVMGHSGFMPEGSRHPDFLPDLGTVSGLAAALAAWMWCRRPDRPHVRHKK